MTRFRSLQPAWLLPWCTLWLAAGIVLLGTVAPAWTPALGWAPLLLLIGCPVLVALVIAPWLPLSLAAVCLRQRTDR